MTAPMAGIGLPTAGQASVLGPIGIALGVVLAAVIAATTLIRAGEDPRFRQAVRVLDALTIPLLVLFVAITCLRVAVALSA